MSSCARTRLGCLAATAWVLATAPALGQRAPSSPLDRLPKNVEVLTRFGERADISPDNRRIAFMAKSFGDALVIDLKTRATRCLTCHVPGAVFLRVMHLVTGDYLLIGPERLKDPRTSRWRESEVWFLGREPGARPVRLGQRLFEGAAVSKKSLKIAWSETSMQNPDLPRETSRLMVGEVDVAAGSVTLANRRAVYESTDASCVIEAQDFYADDTKMTFTCYEPNGKASVMGIDFRTGDVVNFSRAPNTYNEAEGIFPDGLHTCVESDRQVQTLGGEGGFRQIDIWKLRLDGTGRDFVRLTHFNDYEGWKASNPVVSTDGRFMAFQAAKTVDEAGVGRGILLYWFRE